MAKIGKRTEAAAPATSKSSVKDLIPQVKGQGVDEDWYFNRRFKQSDKVNLEVAVENVKANNSAQDKNISSTKVLRALIYLCSTDKATAAKAMKVIKEQF